MKILDSINKSNQSDSIKQLYNFYFYKSIFSKDSDNCCIVFCSSAFWVGYVLFLVKEWIDLRESLWDICWWRGESCWKWICREGGWEE